MTEDKIHKLLQEAQENYGYANQIAVAIEELCELGAVLSKYPRYDFHDDALEALRDKVVEEVADVIIVIRHVQMIFGIQPDELEDMMDKKLRRLQRWLESEDKSFHHTTEDRAVEGQPLENCPPNCQSCYYWEHVDELDPQVCKACRQRGGCE